MKYRYRQVVAHPQFGAASVDTSSGVGTFDGKWSSSVTLAARTTAAGEGRLVGLVIVSSKAFTLFSVSHGRRAVGDPPPADFKSFEAPVLKGQINEGRLSSRSRKRAGRSVLRNSTLNELQRLEQLFFLEGIAYDGNRFNRTAATAPLFSYLVPSVIVAMDSRNSNSRGEMASTIATRSTADPCWSPITVVQRRSRTTWLAFEATTVGPVRC